MLLWLKHESAFCHRSRADGRAHRDCAPTPRASGADDHADHADVVDKALFGTGGPGCGVVASTVPSRTFSTRQADMILAGRVVGKVEVPWPLGSRSVPHLKFVELYFCQESNCLDYRRALIRPREKH